MKNISQGFLPQALIRRDMKLHECSYTECIRSYFYLGKATLTQKMIKTFDNWLRNSNIMRSSLRSKQEPIFRSGNITAGVDCDCNNQEHAKT